MSGLGRLASTEVVAGMANRRYSLMNNSFIGEQSVGSTQKTSPSNLFRWRHPSREMKAHAVGHVKLNFGAGWAVAANGERRLETLTQRARMIRFSRVESLVRSHFYELEACRTGSSRRSVCGDALNLARGGGSPSEVSAECPAE